MDDKLLNMKEACELLHVSATTLRVWEDRGVIESHRTNGGHRRFDRNELLKAVGGDNRHLPKLAIGYCRVSSAGQKADLQRQVEVVTNYCEKQGYRFRVITDVGSGLNYGKPGLTELIKCICNNECSRVVVNYKDRLVRFGYGMLETVCSVHGVDIEIINSTDEISKEQELVDDMLSIVTAFSARMYGQRSHKNRQVVEEARKLFTGQEVPDGEAKETETSESAQNSQGPFKTNSV